MVRLLQEPPAWLKRQVEGILGKLANSGDIEDVIQEAFEEVVLNFDRQDCRTDREVLGYLKKVAHNKAIDLARKDYVKRRDWSVNVMGDEAENEEDDYPRLKLIPMGRQHDPWEHIELKIDVGRALRKLSPKERRVAEFYRDGIPVRDAAAKLEMKYPTVHRWWHQVIKPKLRHELSGYATDSLSYLLRKEREVTAKVEGWRAA